MKAGAPIKTVQTLAGHASPTTTLAVYAHTSLRDDRAAVNRAIPEVSAVEEAALQATGTDDSLAFTTAPRAAPAQRTEGSTPHLVSSTGNSNRTHARADRRRPQLGAAGA